MGHHFAGEELHRAHRHVVRHPRKLQLNDEVVGPNAAALGLDGPLQTADPVAGIADHEIVSRRRGEAAGIADTSPPRPVPGVDVGRVGLGLGPGLLGVLVNMAEDQRLGLGFRFRAVLLALRQVVLVDLGVGSAALG